MKNPGPTHVAAAKRILRYRYLAVSASLGIIYRPQDNCCVSNTLTDRQMQIVRGPTIATR
jgi:hypothetical protein